MNIIHEQNKVYINLDENNIGAYVSFSNIDENTVLIDHTYVSEEFRGKGIASLLMKEAYLNIKKQNLKAKLSCSYAIKWFESNPLFNDILIK